MKLLVGKMESINWNWVLNKFFLIFNILGTLYTGFLFFMITKMALIDNHVGFFIWLAKMLGQGIILPLTFGLFISGLFTNLKWKIILGITSTILCIAWWF